MNGDIKRKIDHLRDLLVGKIPMPTDQVKQITLGLIYKFMSDIDEHNRELGGNSFFSGEYQQYAWKHILDHSLSAFDRVGLYAEGLDKMALNPNIPQLFRDIFKGAFLPFRDPAIVDQFLKGLNEFEYQHSEDLGDAYEYLLSIMGSQGDAGQFRTPRHIIDFIVAAVEPKKEDRVLDPACGTAGFLVSAYKHILKTNTLPGSDRPGSALKSEERKKITENFVGYEISQDMTRISLVNMYLHQFTDPRIYEYDTLTSLDRWNETFDCILTNPPFMSPKGGIQPHNRFGVHSTRSEVLFVDYIMEHLSPGGKAGVIVPEGIIFQSQNAYKQLRKKLVEEGYLYAVVSLPAGVFQPYSGVKTSILLLDRRLAQKARDILFVKVEADGFDLGAQRRPIEKNDLPEILKTIHLFKSKIISNELSEIAYVNNLRIISKNEIQGKDDFVLSINRFDSKTQNKNEKWELVELGNLDLFKIESGGTPDSQNKSYWGGNINWATLIDLPADDFITEITETKRKITEEGLSNSSASILPMGTILFSSRATIGRVAIAFTPIATNQGFKNVVIKNEKRVLPKFVALMLKNIQEQVDSLTSGSTYKEISKTNFEKLLIPLPPIETQREIVAEIEGYQKVIDGARQVVENWKPNIKVDPAWPKIKLGVLSEILDKFRKPVEKSLRKKGPYPYYGATGIVDYVDQYLFDEKLVLIGEDGAKWGKDEETAFIVNGKYWVNNHAHVLRPKREMVLDEWIVYLINAMDITTFITGVTVPKLNQEKLREIEISMASMEQQKQIIDEIKEQQIGVDACKKLIETYEVKIKEKIGEVWGEK